MDDIRARFPESHIVQQSEIDHVGNDHARVCIRGGTPVVEVPKVACLLIDVDSALKVGDTANLSLKPVVGVECGGDGNGVHSSGHELQDGHLRRRVGDGLSLSRLVVVRRWVVVMNDVVVVNDAVVVVVVNDAVVVVMNDVVVVVMNDVCGGTLADNSLERGEG